MLLFTVIAVAVDSSEKTDDFVKSGLSTGQIIKQYYLGFVPYIWGLLFPLFVFIAVIFFTSKMALRSEVIAILASGVTYRRWLQPYVWGGVFFGVILFFAARYVIPKGNGIRSEFQAKYVDSNPGSEVGNNNSFYLRTDTNTYIGIKYFDTSSKTATGVFINRLKAEKLVYNLRADNMKWDAAKKTWQLNNVTERRIDSMQEKVTQVPQLYMNLHVSPPDLRRDYYLKDKLTTPQLKHLINLERLRATEGLNTLEVEQHRRTATSFSVLLLTLIGAIIAGRKTRGGSGLHLATGIIIAAAFIILDRFSTVFSVKGNLPPLLAAWIPNIIFTLIAIRLYIKAPK